ncbi:MAG: Gfo/Idh/MocA family protein [Omnitrophica WOR_2 bacterium]
MDKVRLGVIGCGYWGPNLIRNFVSVPNSEVVVVADSKEDRLQHIRSTYPSIQTTKNYQDFFSMGLDGVVVATPPASHYPLAKECLEQGLHTMVEKPITLKSDDAEDLIELSKQKNLTLMVGHTFEYNPAVRKVKEIIDSGELGQVYYVYTVRVNLGLFQSHLNVLWDLAPHDISILMYILGQDPVSVSALGEDCIFEGKHDVAYMYLTFPNKVLTHIHVSWLDPCKVRKITVVGSKKMLVYDDLESLEKIKIYDKGVEKPPYTDTFADFQCSYRYGDAVIPFIRFTEPLRLECQEFIDCIRDGHREPLSNGMDGLKVVKTLEAAQRSLFNGGVCESLNFETKRVTNLAFER